MKKVLVLDRNYSVNMMKSKSFEVICVALDIYKKKKCINQGQHVVACFEEEYNNIKPSEVPVNYLIHSLESDRFLVRYPYSKRMEILGKEISFWRSVLDDQKPDLIVGECITIEFMEVLYIEATRRGIPYKSWCPHFFNGKTFWVDKPYNSKMPVEFWRNTKVTDANLQEAESMMDDIRIRHKQPSYVNFKQPRKIALMRRFLREFAIEVIMTKKKSLFGAFNYENYSQIFWEHVKNAAALFFHHYDKLEVDEKKEYFFYPLHYEPESAVNYVGDCYDDQIMLIGRIAHCLGTNQILIVKEHPQQRGKLLTRPYREIRKKYPNMVYIDGQESSYDMYKVSKCIITLNGTAGWEALILGKPVIAFGDVYYASCPGVTVCDGFKKLKEIIRNNQMMIPNDEEVKLFVAALLSRLTETRTTSFKEEDVRLLTSQVEAFLANKPQ